MTDYNTISTTGEPVTEQAPTATLPADYLTHGFLSTAPNGKAFLRAEYVGNFAQEIASNLAPLTAANFNTAFLRDTKKHLRRGIPYEAKATCAAAMLPQSIKLVAKHKAPPMLRDLITATTGAVTDDATFEALYKHLDAVYSYLIMAEEEGA